MPLAFGQMKQYLEYRTLWQRSTGRQLCLEEMRG